MFVPKYQTSIPAVIQFITMVLLNFVNGAYLSVKTCRADSSDCVSNLILMLLFILVVTVWFGFIAVLAWAAQDRRSKRLAQVLILAELGVVGAALIDIRNHPDKFSLVISSLDFVLALWVIWLAFRLIRSKGGRVVSTPRRRRPAGR